MVRAALQGELRRELVAAGGIFAALAVGLGLGGAYLYVTRKTAATAADPCAAMKADQAAYLACKAAGILSTIIDNLPGPGAEWDKKSAANDALNGAVAIPNARVSERTLMRPARLDGPVGAMAAGASVGVCFGGAYRYKNGCEPFKNAPGWKKCAAGTNDMTGPNPGVGGKTIDGTLYAWRVEWDKFLSGELYLDPLTPAIAKAQGITQAVKAGDLYLHGDPTSGTFRASGIGPLATFPLPVPAGAGVGWFAGAPFVCPAGQVPLWSGSPNAGSTTSGPQVTDHRTKTFVCGPPGQTAAGYSAPTGTAPGVRPAPAPTVPTVAPRAATYTDLIGDTFNPFR